MEPTGDMPELPDLQDIQIPNAIRPEALNKRMTNDAIVTMFVSHVYYMYDGRHLAREDTSSLMRRYWYTNSYMMNHDPFDKFENPNAALRIALQPLGDTRKQAVIAYVDHLFRNLLKEDPEVEARARILSGFPERLPKIDLGVRKDALLVRTKQLEPYQYLFHYAAVNWGTDRQDKALNEEQVTGVLVFHYKFDSRIGEIAINNCSQVLANPNHSTTKRVAPIAEIHKAFFKDKVVKEFEEYEKSKSQGSLSKSMPGLDPLSNVTEALENSALQTLIEPRLQFPEDQAQGPRRQELLERARRDEMNKSEEGQKKEGRRKRSKSPDSRQHYRPKPPPPPPPAAGPSRTPRPLPYDPTRS